jgi:hypothetical protein
MADKIGLMLKKRSDISCLHIAIAVVFISMRFTYVAVGIAVLFIAPVVPSAHADTGISNFVRCIQQGDPGIPPRERAEDWIPTVQIIEFGLNSALNPAEVAQKLVGAGVKPNDAAAEVQCVQATNPY